MVRCSSLVLLCLASLTAHAQILGDPEGSPTGPAAGDSNGGAPATGDPAEPSPPPPPPDDASRIMAPPPEAADPGTVLRNGFSISVGQELGSGPSDGLSGQLYGIDWRIGAKISEPLSIYVHSHLSFGTAKIGAQSGYTGNLAVAAIGE